MAEDALGLKPSAFKESALVRAASLQSAFHLVHLMNVYSPGK